MGLTLKDFSAVAGSADSIGYIMKTLDGGGLQKVDHHKHLTSMNLGLASIGCPSNAEVRQALAQAIEAALQGKVDPARQRAFMDSVRHKLGVEEGKEVSIKALDRRTVRALVMATELEIGNAGRIEKASEGVKMLAAFLGGKSDGSKIKSDVLLGLMKGVEEILKEPTQDAKGNATGPVSDIWVNGIGSGESIRLQRTKDDFVTLDCGGGVKFKLKGDSLKAFVEKMQLAIVGTKDLAKPELENILARVGRSFPKPIDLNMFSGDSSPEIRFARKLCEKVLLTHFGDQGLTENELRNVPAYTMHYLAGHIHTGGGMALQDLRDYVALVCADRLNTEETLSTVDRYQKAADKDCVGYASERKAESNKVSLFPKFELPGFMKTLVGGVKKVKGVLDGVIGLQAMLADVVSDKRTFLGEQHPEPGGRLQITLQSHVKDLAFLLSQGELIVGKLPDEASAFVKPLLEAARSLLGGDDALVNLKSADDIEKALRTALADAGAKEKLVPLETAIDGAASALCTKMQYKMNHAFAQVFSPANAQSQGAERYDELIDAVFDNELFANEPLEKKNALMETIDAFVDSFAKVGWSGKALDRVFDEALKGASSLDDASQRVGALVTRYKMFSEVAQQSTAPFVGPDDPEFEKVEKFLDTFKANAAGKEQLHGEITSFLGQFAKAGLSFPYLSNLSLRLCTDENKGNYEKFKLELKTFNDRLKPVTDFLKKVPLENLLAPVKSGDVPSIAARGLDMLIMSLTDPKVIKGTADTKKNKIVEGYIEKMNKIAEGYINLKDPSLAVDCMRQLGQDLFGTAHYMGGSKQDGSGKALAKLETALKDPANVRPQSGVRNLADFLAENGMDESGVNRAERKPSTDLAQLRLLKSRALLTKLGGGADMDKGYGLFMTKVMKRYVKSMGVSDQRAMLAAGLRFGEIKGSPVKKMGAFLKGAGPIMQKMLQGFASMDVDKDFRAALADMKSRLPPIPDDVVKANLLDMVRRSKGAITAIEMTKPLGAASVGQAFLCTVTMSSGEKRDVVVKMLRPEAEQRAEREKDLFIAVSKEVGGMERTFAGQLESILQELDLRNEAVNTREGAVYDKGGMNVKSMKLLDVIEPTKYTMVVEKAPGTTVDRLIEDAEKTLKDLTAPFYKKEKKTDADGNEVEVRVPDPDAFKDKDGHQDQAALSAAYGKAIAGLSRLYEETLVQQQHLVTLASKWTLNGIYGEGFYHGDLHAGNIMVDNTFVRDANGKLLPEKNGGLTVIDFGNATKLTPEQQKNIIKMMTAATTKDTNVFLDNFCELMSPGGQADFRKDRQGCHDLVHNIFNLGNGEDAAGRIFAALQQLQLRGHELPGPIFKFSQCSIRLQGTIDQMNTLLKSIKAATLEFRKSIELDFGNLPDELEAMDVHGALLKGMFKGGTVTLGDGNVDFDELQKLVDVKLETFEPKQPKVPTKKAPPPTPLPSKHLENWCNDLTNAWDPLKVCDELKASMAGLKTTHRELFDRLEVCRQKVATEFEELKNSDDGKSLVEEMQKFDTKTGQSFETHMRALKLLDTLESLREFVKGKEFKTFLERLSDALGGYDVDVFVDDESAHREFCSQDPRYAALFDCCKGILGEALKPDEAEKQNKASIKKDINIIRNILLNGTKDNKIDGTKDNKIDGTEGIDRRSIVGQIEVFGQGVSNLSSDVEKIVKLQNKVRSPVRKAMVEFGEAYDAAQKAMLEDLKKVLAPICHKNEKGVVDSRMVPKGALKDFGDAVGHVIADNLWSSIFRNGLGLVGKTIFKTVTGFNQGMKV